MLEETVFKYSIDAKIFRSHNFRADNNENQQLKIILRYVYNFFMMSTWTTYRYIHKFLVVLIRMGLGLLRLAPVKSKHVVWRTVCAHTHIGTDKCGTHSGLPQLTLGAQGLQ